MRVIITRPLDENSKGVITATLDTMRYYLKLLSEQMHSTSHTRYIYFNPSYLLNNIWERKYFLEKVYNVKIVKD